MTASAVVDPPPEHLDSTWAVVGDGADLVVGPWRALRASSATVRALVTVLPEDTLVPGRETRRVRVAESGVREFEVVWADGPHATTVATNPAGGNKVAWSADRSRFWLSPAGDAHLSAVYLRFVLRHLTTEMLSQDLHARAVHAVAGSLRTPAGGVVAVCGPTRSGKTRLVNRLIVGGLLAGVVDDDCPLVAGGRLHSLVPARYEVVRATTHQLAGLVLLDANSTEARRLDSDEAARLLRTTPRPWPAPWLPAGGEVDGPDLPSELPVVALPVRDDGEADHDDVSRLLAPCLR